jgi:hypothetical protein
LRKLHISLQCGMCSPSVQNPWATKTWSGITCQRRVQQPPGHHASHHTESPFLFWALISLPKRPHSVEFPLPASCHLTTLALSHFKEGFPIVAGSITNSFLS